MHLGGHNAMAVANEASVQRARISVSRIQAAAAEVGELVAERAAGSKVAAVHWARKQGQRYHGKIAALLQSMQAAGLPLH